MSLGRVSGVRNGMLRELAKKVTVPSLVKKSSKSRSFHYRYLELCRNKNLTPLPEIRKKSNETTILELNADKLGVSDWLLIIEALHHDLALKCLVLRLRRTYEQNTIDPIDSENRARLYTQRPVVFTRFIFRGLVQAIANCVMSNKNLTVLKLEGLPLYDVYIESISKSLDGNDRLETLSFRRCMLGDKGCELLCNTVKYLNQIASVDLSGCHITAKGACHLAEMIKIQKIARYTEGWQKSLRYQTPDINSLLGLRTIIIANNPEIGDKGLNSITEVLKEDAWIRVVDMECCGLTDIGANTILGLLELNNVIKEFNVRNNEGISPLLHRSIRNHLKTAETEEHQEPECDLNWFSGLEHIPQSKRFPLIQMLSHTRILEEQLSFEQTLRKKAEDLNVKLSSQLMCIDSKKASDKVISVTYDIHNVDLEMKKEDIEGSPTYRQMQMTNEDLQMEMKEEDHKKSLTYRKGHKTNENVEMVEEEDLKDSRTYRQTQFDGLIDSSVNTPEVTPRSDMTETGQERTGQKQTEENYAQSEVEPMDISHFEEQQTSTRQLLGVRKVRSEMKYVEPNVKSRKSHESKSDYEFANERRFNLKSNVQFEQDIGDSARVYGNQQERYPYEETEDDELNASVHLEQEIGEPLIVEAKGGPKKGPPRYGGAGDGAPIPTMQFEQEILEPITVKGGHKKERSRYEGAGDGGEHLNSMEQFDQENEEVIMVQAKGKGGHKKGPSHYEEAEDDELNPSVQLEHEIESMVKSKGSHKKGRARYAGAGDGELNSLVQEIGEPLMVKAKGSHKKGRARYAGAGDEGEQLNSMEQFEQDNIEVVMVQAKAKVGHKKRRARNEGAGDVETIPMEQFEHEILEPGTFKPKGGHKKGRARYEGAGDVETIPMEQFEHEILEPGTFKPKGGHKKGRARYEGAGDGGEHLNSMEQVEQDNEEVVMVQAKAKGGHKKRRARYEGAGDGEHIPMEQFEQDNEDVVSVKGSHEQVQDRNEGGKDGKRCKKVKQRRCGTMPETMD
ncbi:protein Cep78 homolog [Drosophila obscura]|uniref:protein Cep78 homolog n=1 Tax=Drosophila obscura TaxID=7282 RepID=UPI001BB1840E|nr:protein Cep78 homolog [Drosophila obscura]